MRRHALFRRPEQHQSGGDVRVARPLRPALGYHLLDSYFIAGSFSRTFAEIGPYLSYEIEAGAGQRLGSLHEEEVWLALYARWKYFPWNDYVRTTAAVSTGVDYASAIPQYEVYYSGNNQGNRLLHYISPEVTFGLPSYAGH